MDPGDLKAGAEASFSYVVQEADTALALTPITGDEFPRVFATTRCIALLELAAGKLLVPLLEKGQLSVGVDVEVRHLAATPVGARVEARARYTGREGKLFTFEVVALDGGGEIMRGKHRRAIIENARLLESAARRNPR